MLHLINHEPDIVKIYLYAKEPYEVKYQLLIKKREGTSIKYLNCWKAFIEYSNDVDDIHKDIEEYNQNEKRKMLIEFDDMIVDMLSDKKLNPVVTELFIRGKQLQVSLVFITQSYFAVPKNTRLNSIQYFVMKIPNKGEIQQNAFSYSSDTDFQKFTNFHKKYMQSHIFFGYWYYSCIR